MHKNYDLLLFNPLDHFLIADLVLKEKLLYSLSFIYPYVNLFERNRPKSIIKEEEAFVWFHSQESCHVCVVRKGST